MRPLVSTPKYRRRLPGAAEDDATSLLPDFSGVGHADDFRRYFHQMPIACSYHAGCQPTCRLIAFAFFVDQIGLRD